MSKELMEVQVIQRDENEFISLTDLQSIYDNQCQLNGWSNKQISKFFENQRSKTIIAKRLHIPRNECNIKKLKSLGLYITTGRGSNKKTFCVDWLYDMIKIWLFDVDIKTHNDRICSYEHSFYINTLTKLFNGYTIERQFNVDDIYYIDFYIKELSLAIEFDEKHHKNRTKEDIERQTYIENRLKCKFLRYKQ